MVYAIVAVIILIIDQAVKYWTTLNLALGDTQALIPNVVELTNVHNSGAAYGLLSGANARWLFVGLTVVFAILIIWLLAKDVIEGKMGKWTIVLVLAGGLGNCIDRIINGYVVDMFHFTFPVFGRDYPVFNVADMFISVCGLLFCIWLIFHKRPEAPAMAEKASAVAREKATSTPDYMSQMEKPVAEAKVELTNVEPAPVRRPSMPTAGADPFADFSAPAAPAAPASPVQQPVQPKAAPKSGDEFSLDSIMAEFKDL